MTENNHWEDNSRKSKKPMTIDHAGTRYIGIPEEELRVMNKELEDYRKDRLTNTVEAIKESLDPNEWYRGGGSSVSSDLDALDCGNALRCDDIVLYKVEDTYFRAQGLSEENTKNWAIVKAWILERRSNWSRARMEEHTAPHPNVLKGVAMQMPYAQNKEMAKKPYTFDGLTDGLSPEDKKRALKKAGMNNLDAFDGPKTTMPEVDEKGQVEKPNSKDLGYYFQVGTEPFDWPDFQPPLDEKNYDNIKEAAEKARARFEVAKLKAAVDSGQTIVDEHGSTVERHAISGLEHAVLYRHTLDKSLQYKNYCPASSNWGTISTYMKVTSGWHIKPSSPSVNEVIAELKLGRKFRSEDGWTVSNETDCVYAFPPNWCGEYLSWSNLPKFLEGKKWERV